MKRRVAIVVSSPMTAKVFLRDQIRALSEMYEVTLFANVRCLQDSETLGKEVCLQTVPIERDIAPLKDLIALWQMTRELRRGRFDLVHSVTPKAGLLAMVGGFLAGVPHRIHTFTGQVWATRRGLGRFVLKNMDRLTALTATMVLVDSPSQRDFLLLQGVVKADKSMVLGEGSIGGVDLQRFRPDPEIRKAVRTQLGVDDSVPLLLFVGRLKRDKGILDLAKAYAMLGGAAARSVLLVIGPDEEHLRGDLETLTAERRNGLRLIPYTEEPERYMAAADIFCLPSYREGFGGVIIEAAACAVPAVGSRIYGISDAIVDGQTGLLHEPGDVDAIHKHLQRLIENSELRTRMGKVAHERVAKLFPRERLTSAMLTLYEKLFN